MNTPPKPLSQISSLSGLLDFAGPSSTLENLSISSRNRGRGVGRSSPAEWAYRNEWPRHDSKWTPKQNSSNWASPPPTTPVHPPDPSEVDNRFRAPKPRSECVQRAPAPRSVKSEQPTRAVKGLLNKLTVEKFARIVEQVAIVIGTLTTSEELKSMVALVVDKAVTESSFSEMYADLCYVLKLRLGNKKFPDVDGGHVEYSQVLLNAVQKEFESIPKSFTEFQGSDEASALRLAKCKRRVFGTAVVVGELFNRRMVPTRILTNVTNILLMSSNVPEEHFIDSMCQLLTISGSHLDTTAKGRTFVDQAVYRLRELQPRCSKRLSCIIQDLLDAREAMWYRRVRTEKAKTLAQLKSEAEREDILGGSIVAAQFGSVVKLGERSNLMQPDSEYSKFMRSEEEKFGGVPL